MRAVLFDLDGTLVNSLPEISHGVNEALARQGKPALSDEKIAAMIGRGVSVLADRVTAACAPDSPDRDRLFQDIVDAWAESNGRGTVLFPDAASVIAELRARGIRVGLVTNKLRDLTLSFLKDRGMEGWFDVVVAGDDCPQPKPAPDMILRALSELGVSAERVRQIEKNALRKMRLALEEEENSL